MVGSGDILTDRQINRETDTQTDVLITILRHRSSGQSKNAAIRTFLEIIVTKDDRGMYE